MSHFNYIPGVYNPPIAHYNELPVPNYVDVGLLIGKGGKHFKYITYKSKCTYIWYNKDRRVIELWGPEWALQDAMKEFMARFELFKPDLSLDELESRVTTVATYTREDGSIIHELEGEEWIIHEFCPRKYITNFHIENSHLGEDGNFWAKVVVNSSNES